MPSLECKTALLQKAKRIETLGTCKRAHLGNAARAATGFITFVKKRIATMNPTPRFQELRSSYQYSESRGYPCVDAKITFDDTAAVTPTGNEQRKLQVISLYCRHPTQQDIGFFAAFSHRGKTIDEQLESPAKNFIEGINVPKK